MIKFDKDVLRALQALERKGFETYAAGVCVRDQILGLKVYDWDESFAGTGEKRV